ncbi:putative ankyrin repeat protein RF_0381 isoform X2 [Daphnia pulicaria]|uniref:putative ankyrin repeat protein RF_0381 isoform X2 n=1 Tax=Daphnia pulicaria TaxID=35523 RepID=UPI001EEAC179|nr:putative ankyrin repeat protein RF_0381 isoform X2 [Daphnia pulicaria]
MQKLQSIELDPRDKLGQGGFGSVFNGKFGGKEVAVKRVESIETDEREEDALKKLNHMNVVRLYHVESDNAFKYFALELCKASLDQLFLDESNPKKYTGPSLPHHFTVLLQLASGLDHIHSKNLIHRDIKPENVLISVGSDDQKVTMKWADFGLSKPVNERGTFSMSGIKGTTNWMAPELLKGYSAGHRSNAMPTRGTIKSDIFAEGLVFGYYLGKGVHPFGSNRLKIPSNIEKGKPVNMENIQPSSACEMIIKMLENNPENRITSPEIVLRLEKLKKEMEIELFKLLEAPNVDLKEVKALIDEGVDINCFNEEGCTPFLYLIKRCSTKDNLKETVQFFIENNIDVNIKDKDERNALHFLCMFYGKEDLIDLIQMLVRRGIVVDSTDNEGQNALHLLCEHYKKDNIKAIIAILIDNGIDVNSYTKEKWNALHISCKHYQRENLIDVVKLLIERGIDVNLKNNFEDTALQTLCRNYRYGKWIGIIRMLIQCGTDVNNRTNKGWNVLHTICNAKYQELDLIEEIRLLIDHGIDVKSINDGGWNALHILCQNYKKENLIEIIQIFIQNGIDVNSKNKDGWNALHILCQNYKEENLIEIIRLFIQNGIDINSTNDSGWNVLHTLCHNYKKESLIEVIRLLIQNGIDVNSANDDGWNALQILCQNNKNDNLIFVFLFNRKLTSTARTKKGGTFFNCYVKTIPTITSSTLSNF